MNVTARFTTSGARSWSIFDASLIGLTATPDNRTYGFFRKNVVSEYAHEQAVADGVNVGNENLCHRYGEDQATVANSRWPTSRSRNVSA